jgi:hypothetical protein
MQNLEAGRHQEHLAKVLKMVRVQKRVRVLQMVKLLKIMRVQKKVRVLQVVKLP